MQKFSDSPLERCPECDGPVSKLMSLTSFSLKGSGWYTTDYKRAPSGNAVGKSGGSADPTQKSAEGPVSSGSKDGSKDGPKESSVSAETSKKDVPANTGSKPKDGS